MYKLNNQTTHEQLQAIGFIEKDIIIHPSRVDRSDEVWLGQKDENGQSHPLYVLRIPKFGRFDVDIVVNYRNEVYASMSGFMAGGLELNRDLDDKSSKLYFNAEGRFEYINELIKKIAIKED